MNSLCKRIHCIFSTVHVLPGLPVRYTTAMISSTGHLHTDMTKTQHGMLTQRPSPTEASFHGRERGAWELACPEPQELAYQALNAWEQGALFLA